MSKRPLTPESESQNDRKHRTLFSRLFRLGIRIGLVAFVIISIAAYVIYSSAQKEPDFYQAALSISDEDHKRQGDQFEKQLLELQNEARTKQDWLMAFTEAQVNGWIVSDFPEKFPNTLPRGISDPRVVIDEHELTVVFRFRSTRFKGIVQARADVFCTDVPNQIGVQIKRVRCGVIPIPIDSVADRLTRSLRRLGMNVTWTEINSDPVALIDLPSEKIRIGDKRIEIEAIEFLAGKLILSGHSISEN